MINDKTIEAAYQAVEAAAIAGERCPTNKSADNPSGVLQPGVTGALADEGRVRFEVYAHNWRVAEILTGPHRGKRTKGPPNPAWRPYLIVDQNGSRKV